MLAAWLFTQSYPTGPNVCANTWPDVADDLIVPLIAVLALGLFLWYLGTRR